MNTGESRLHSHVYDTTRTLVMITFDPAKRDATLRERGLDFRNAEEVFAGPVFEFADERVDYGK